ncbi:unnamed protein product [Triticum turgidum subsp. durum]|uniref:Transmembrane protein n=1 Tax=Triticum turgidum subsp. durum TaxID=4567 RepID=A0A9R1RW92_TRITD|nr:unnamed protein product [Triticum turgidum subsp. durum]
MRNGSSGSSCSSSSSPPVGLHLQQVFGSQASSHGHGQRLVSSSSTCPRPVAELLQVTWLPAAGGLLNALASLSFLLLLAYLSLFLLAKLFARLHRAREHRGRDNRAESNSGKEDVAADDDIHLAGGERQQAADTLFWFDEAVYEDSALLGLGDEAKNHHLLYTGAGGTAAQHCLEVAETSRAFHTAPPESTNRVSFAPREEEDHRIDSDAATAGATATVAQEEEEAKVDVTDDGIPKAPDGHRQNIPVAASLSLPKNDSVQGNLLERQRSRGGEGRRDGDHREDGHGVEEEPEEEEETAGGFPEVKRLVNSHTLADTKKLQLDGGARLRPRREEEDGDSCRFGASTLTSESTSKSSVEWQSSTVTTGKDAYSDLFSSSSRRSSARWESYTLFRKYDEDMVYFHRVGAQKLTETESFRSIKCQPRSMSQRITHKLSMAAPRPKPASAEAPAIGLRDPYPELERVYVAQICLTWEALNWNYTTFRRHNAGISGTMMAEARCCPARVAQEFQQFQVLLYRFMENEPFEHGRRPEVYARMKNSSPKLLLVPEFREEEDEKDDLISAVQFLHILEESIRTFMAFLRADKRSHYQMFREMVRRRTSASDQSIVITLKRTNKAKKSRLKDLSRPRRCLKRIKLREQEEVAVLLGLIDLKVVARVLRMPEITDQQLHWCEEKMGRLRVDPQQGAMERDPSPLFFPAH